MEVWSFSVRYALQLTKIHYLNLYLDLEPWGSGAMPQETLPNTLYAMFMQKLLWPTVKKEIHLQDTALLDLDLHIGVKVSRSIAQYLLHHVTYAPATFIVAMNNGLGGDTLTRNTLFDLWPRSGPVPTTLYDLCACKVSVATSIGLRKDLS